MALKTLCGLWKGKTKAGRDCLTTKLNKPIEVPEGASLMLLRNDNRKTDKSPEYNLLWLVPDNEQQQDEYTPPPPADDVPF